MSIQTKVGMDKQKHPERFCPVPRCLWRMAKLDHATQTFSWPNGRYCPRHKHLEAKSA
jgi:hypothetical protein